VTGDAPAVSYPRERVRRSAGMTALVIILLLVIIAAVASYWPTTSD
jgi:hypothetical protein